jgi:hypothetical protein
MIGISPRQESPPPTPLSTHNSNRKRCTTIRQRKEVRGLNYGNLVHLHRRNGTAITTTNSVESIERRFPKLDVAGSIPVSRSIFLNSTTASGLFALLLLSIPLARLLRAGRTREPGNRPRSGRNRPRITCPRLNLYGDPLQPATIPDPATV